MDQPNFPGVPWVRHFVNVPDYLRAKETDPDIQRFTHSPGYCCSLACISRGTLYNWIKWGWLNAVMVKRKATLLDPKEVVAVANSR